MSNIANKLVLVKRFLKYKLYLYANIFETCNLKIYLIFCKNFVIVED